METVRSHYEIHKYAREQILKRGTIIILSCMNFGRDLQSEAGSEHKTEFMGLCYALSLPCRI